MKKKINSCEKNKLITTKLCEIFGFFQLDENPKLWLDSIHTVTVKISFRHISHLSRRNFVFKNKRSQLKKYIQYSMSKSILLVLCFIRIVSLKSFKLNYQCVENT